MYNQEEKEYQDFMDKFLRSVFELKIAFENLSEKNKVRIKEYIVNSAETQVQLKILHSLAKRS